MNSSLANNFSQNNFRQIVDRLERSFRIDHTLKISLPQKLRQRKASTAVRTRFVNAARLSQANQPNLRSTYALISLHGDPIANLCQPQVDRQADYVRRLGIALAKQGSQVDIFTRREHPDLNEVVEIAPGCRMIRLAVGPEKVLPQTELATLLPTFAAACVAFQIKSAREYTMIESNYWLSSWIENCVRLPQPFRLYIVSGTNGGEGQERQRLQDLVKELGLQSATSFIGTVPAADLPNCYVAANVFFVPSYYEPFGLVAIEAMGVGTPVGGDAIAMPIPTRDPSALATEITAIDNPQSSASNQMPGSKWIHTNFSSATVTSRQQHIYQSSILAESVRAAIDSQQIVPIFALQLQQLPQFQQLDGHQQKAILDRLLIFLEYRET